jgi:hypothetical protein
MKATHREPVPLIGSRNGSAPIHTAAGPPDEIPFDQVNGLSDPVLFKIGACMRGNLVSLAASGALVFGTVVALPTQVGATTHVASPARSAPHVAAAAHHDRSLPLRDMRATRALSRSHPARALPRRSAAQNLTPAPMTPVTGAVVTGPSSLTPGSLNFNGVGQGFTGPQGAFSVSSAPPDTTGAAGPNDYVQMVNSSIAVFSKSGTALYGPVPTNTLWAGFGGGCQTNNDGDGGVQYDQYSNRWILTQFSVTTTPYLECVALSQTSDPLGAWNRYSFSYANFNDYPKIGVWPDAYYATFNMFSGTSSFLGAKVCAYDKSQMLLGLPATQQCFDTSSTYGGLLAANADGPTPPPAGEAETVVAMDNNALDTWKFHVDFATPANSTFAGPTLVAVPGFAQACGGATCIPQAGTAQQLDSLADRLMNRLVYRNFGDHEALVVDHSVTIGSAVGIRWYELRLGAGGSVSPYQSGTYAPDASYRWMGSVAFDGVGDIAMGYSQSSPSVHPGIRYTGRLPGDPSGAMTQGETTIVTGGGSQASGLSRWGDYSQLTVDPVDDCTFWYTNEYLTANGSFNWSTRIGTFRFSNCGNTTGLFPTTPTVTNVPATAYLGGSFSPLMSTTGDGTTSVTSSTNAVCVMSASTVQYVGAGTCLLTAHVAHGVLYRAADGFPQPFGVLGFTIDTATLPSATRGTAYGPVTLQAFGTGLSATGYVTTIKWKKVSVPKGMKLSSAGILSGTPSTKLAAGPSSVDVIATETVTTLNGKLKVKTLTTVQATIPLAIG